MNSIPLAVIPIQIPIQHPVGWSQFNSNSNSSDELNWNSKFRILHKPGEEGEKRLQLACISAWETLQAVEDKINQGKSR